MKFGTTPEAQAAQLGKQAVRHLVHDTSLPALALIHEIRDDRVKATFPGQDVLAKIAADEGLFLAYAVQTLPTGFDHVLFLAKSDGLAEEALLACRHLPAHNRHAAGDGPWKS